MYMFVSSHEIKLQHVRLPLSTAELQPRKAYELLVFVQLRNAIEPRSITLVCLCDHV
jgi:hypothetical protein